LAIVRRFIPVWRGIKAEPLYFVKDNEQMVR